MTLVWVTAILAIIFNTFVNPIALEAIGWKYYIVFIVLLVVYSILAWFFFPETKGYTLEEIAVVFDGDRAGVLSPDDAATMAELKSGLEVQRVEVGKESV